MSTIFIDDLSIPNIKYNLGIGSYSHGKQVGKILVKLEKLIKLEKPDAVLVYGDTNSTLAGSLSAKKLGLPIFHVEAGLRSHNRLMFEENNRIITDHLSSLLFCPSKKATENLLKEKLTNGVILSGDVMYEVYLKFSSYKDNLDLELKKLRYNNLYYEQL